MNTTEDRNTTAAGSNVADIEQRANRALHQFAFGLAVFFAIALGTLTWLVAAPGVADVSAASDAAAPGSPRVTYVPAQYVNQATEVEMPLPTF